MILTKLVEYLTAYSNHVKELILNKGALNYGKIKSKSITGKHLLLAYSQLKFVKFVAHMIAGRWNKFAHNGEVVRERIEKNMGDVSKKFRTVL